MVATTIKRPQRIIRAVVVGLLTAAGAVVGAATAATAQASGIYGTDTVVNCASGPGNKDLSTPASVRITAGEGAGVNGCIQVRDQRVLSAEGIEY